MDNHTNRFKDYVTSSAFNLNLSRLQIQALSDLYEGDKGQIRSATIVALEQKGLVAFRNVGNVFDMTQYQLTEAGEKLVELLVVAGLCSAKLEASNAATV
jgi:DNA-binding HxlR family transcriptional regulator